MMRSAILCIALLTCLPPADGQEISCDLRYRMAAIAPLRVNGELTRAFIDSGATHVCVMPEFSDCFLKKFAERKSELLMVEGPRMAPMKLEVPCQLGDFEPRNVTVNVVSLPEFQERLGKDVDAICGMSLLRDTALSITDNSLKIFIGNLDQSTLGSIESAILFGRAKIPKTRVTIGPDAELEFGIDTGMLAPLCIHTKAAEFFVASNDAAYVNPPGRPENSTIMIREIQLWGTTFRNVPAMVGTINSIGMEMMRTTNVILDFRRNVAITPQPPKPGKDSFAMDASGIGIFFDDNGKASVRRIVEKTPAAETDIHVGDEFVAIDDVLLKDTTLLDASHRLSAAGTTVKLDFKRDGKPYTVHLPLKRDFEYPPKWKVKEPDKKADDFFKFLQENAPK